MDNRRRISVEKHHSLSYLLRHAYLALQINLHLRVVQKVEQASSLTILVDNI